MCKFVSIISSGIMFREFAEELGLLEYHNNSYPIK